MCGFPVAIWIKKFEMQVLVNNKKNLETFLFSSKTLFLTLLHSLARTNCILHLHLCSLKLRLFHFFHCCASS
jgi:hypothetical protein